MSDAGSAPTDSAGQPWRARSLASTGFDDDDGSAAPALLAALGGPLDAALVALVRSARLLVPVVAVPGELQRAEDGLVHDARVDMAVVTLLAPDGTRALPVFTSVRALTTWDAQARPVPVSAARAAQAAVAEGCSELVVDLSCDHARTLRPSMLWALAQERAWLPGHEDPHVAQAVAAALADESDVTAYDLGDGEPAGVGVLRIGLRLRSGLAPEQVREVATRVGERLATDGELRARIDGLAFVIH